MPAYRTSALGVLQQRAPTAAAWTDMAIPYGISYLPIRPDWVSYRGSAYLAGQFSRVLRIDQDIGVHPIGISPPPNCTLTAGAGDITGDCFISLTFGHRAPNGRLITESNPSAPSATVNLVGQGRVAGNLPQTSPDPRVNVLRCYASVDGLDSRFAWERELGTVSSVTESMPTLALGEVLVSTHGVPPYAVFVAKYHERLFFVDPALPYRLWYTELGESEYVASTNFMDTPAREAINGIGENSDILLVQGVSVSYALHGYDGTDFRFTNISPVVGVVSHWGGKDIGDRRLFPTPQGVVMWNGGTFVNTMTDDLLDYWIADYKANQVAYEKAVAEVDDAKGLYYLTVVRTSAPGGGLPRTVRYVGKFDQKVFGGPASAVVKWMIDTLDREETAIGKVSDGGSRQPVMVFGAADGYVRKEDATNGNDDSDTRLKKMVVQFGHDYFEDYGGDRNHGKRFIEHTVFLKNENQAATVKLYAGGNSAPSALPQKTKVIPAGAISGKAARDHYSYKPLISGEGLTRRLEIENPVGIEFYGDAGSWIDGSEARPATP